MAPQADVGDHPTTGEAIRDEPNLTEEQRQATRLLRNDALQQTRANLGRVAEVWQMLHRHAKKTMHGVGCVRSVRKSAVFAHAIELTHPTRAHDSTAETRVPDAEPS